MKKLLMTLAALPLAAYASGASAQTYSNAGGTVAIQNRIANLEGRFNAGLNAGVFTSTERNAISRQLADLRVLEQRYSYDGLSQTERRALQQRIRAVRDQLRMAGGSNWARSYGWNDADLDTYADAYGRGDSYGAYGRGGSYDAYGRPMPSSDVTYDRYGRPIANNGVVYDRYGRPVANNGVVYDRYGRPIATNGDAYGQYGRPSTSGGYYGQGGPYEPIPQSSRGGNVLGGVLGNVLGGGGGMSGILGSILGRGGLRTGDVISSTIGSVLGSAVGFGPQYRDTSNVYYRSDGERVYGIDARTNRVVGVYPVQR